MSSYEADSVCSILYIKFFGVDAMYQVSEIQID